MDGVWVALVILNAVAYVSLVDRRGEASLGLSLLLAAVLGPFVWVVWFAQSAGRRRAERSQ